MTSAPSGGNDVNSSCGKTATQDILNITITISTKTPPPVFLAGFVLLVGLVGATANATVIFIISRARLSHSVKSINTLILNQLAIDLYSCVVLVITYSFRLFKFVYPSSPSPGDIALCMLLDSELLLSFGLDGSAAGLVLIATERYFKIVHSVSHRRYYRTWMTYVAIAITWTNGAIVEGPATALTTFVKKGECLAYISWPDVLQPISFSSFYFIWHYLGPSILLVYLYWHIGIVIRERIKVTPDGPNRTDIISAREKVAAHNQVSGIKTLVIIATLFIIAWLPNQIYAVLAILPIPYTKMDSGWYATMFVAFLAICCHPFMYAGKIDGLKQYMKEVVRKVAPEVVITVVPVDRTSNDIARIQPPLALEIVID